MIAVEHTTEGTIITYDDSYVGLAAGYAGTQEQIAKLAAAAFWHREHPEFDPDQWDERTEFVSRIAHEIEGAW